MTNATLEAHKVDNFSGWTEQARWLNTYDLTNLGFPQDKLPPTPYAYSALKSVYTDSEGMNLFCLFETRHRRFEVWAVPLSGCVVDPDYTFYE